MVEELTPYQKEVRAKRAAADVRLQQEISAAVERFKKRIGRHHDVVGLRVHMIPKLEPGKPANFCVQRIDVAVL